MKTRTNKRYALGVLLTVIVAFLAGCQPAIYEQDLSFLAAQKKPLTYRDVVNRLGDTEPGKGPFYSYRIKGGKKRAEFWMSAPPAPGKASPSSIPAEIALVVVRSEGEKPVIVWPEDLKGKDFNEAIKSIWSQRQ